MVTGRARDLMLLMFRNGDRQGAGSDATHPAVGYFAAVVRAYQRRNGHSIRVEGLRAAGTCASHDHEASALYDFCVKHKLVGAGVSNDIVKIAELGDCIARLRSYEVERSWAYV